MNAVLCIRCTKESTEVHKGWDPKGPVCQDCWFEEASYLTDQQYEQWLKECRG